MKKLAIASALLASLGFSGIASAESTTGNAQVHILSAITFVEDQIVDFKYLLPAGNADETCSMAANGVLSGDCAGQPDGTPGQFTVSGTAGQAVAISVSNGSTDNGVTYNPTLASNNATADTGTLDGSGDLVIGVIGSLDLTANTAAGARSLTYTLTVDYN